MNTRSHTLPNSPPIVILVVLVLVTNMGRPAANAERPNILMIAVDDLRPELASFGVDFIHSPQIDRLAKSGIRFERAYCQVAVCGASRASLLSGYRPETTGCWDFKTPMRSKLPDVLSLPQNFKRSGYVTTFLGKVYHSPKDDPQGWSHNADRLAPPRRPSPGNWARSYPEFETAATTNGKRPKRGPSVENGGAVTDDAYQDGQIADRACRVLKEFAKTDEPFFLAVGFKKPHLPFTAPGKYFDLYDPSQILIPPRADLIGGLDYARSNWGELKQYPDIPNVEHLNDQKTRELIHGYRAAISFTDAQIGKLLDALEQNGLRENTIVALWGDHGFYVGDYGDWCKHTNEEVATRVPLIISAPGVKAGGVSTGLVELVDLYPTLCDLAGLPVPSHCHGVSLRPLLMNPDLPGKPAALSQYKKFKRGTGRMLGTSVRSDRFRYTRWVNDNTGEFDGAELVDFEFDPGATRNVIGDPRYANDIERLEKLASRSGKGFTIGQAADQ